MTGTAVVVEALRPGDGAVRSKVLDLSGSPEKRDAALEGLRALILAAADWWSRDGGVSAVALYEDLRTGGHFEVEIRARLDAYFLQHLRGGYFPRSKQLQGLGKHPFNKREDGLEFDPRYRTVFFIGFAAQDGVIPTVELYRLWSPRVSEVMQVLARVQRGTVQPEAETPTDFAAELGAVVTLAGSDSASRKVEDLAPRLRSCVESRSVPSAPQLAATVAAVLKQRAQSNTLGLLKLLAALELLAAGYEAGFGADLGPDYRAVGGHLARTEVLIGVVERFVRLSPYIAN